MPNFCCVKDCDREHYAKGLCEKHYQRLKNSGSINGRFAREPLEKRFWQKVEKASDDECWLWTGGVGSSGYGVIIDSGKNRSAHRISYEINVGPIPDGLFIMHKCDNRICVNPNHLRTGTQSENIQDAFDKGRKQAPKLSGEQNPKSKLTLEKVRFIKENPQLGHKAIADMFGLSPNAIRGVRIGRTWKDA